MTIGFLKKVFEENEDRDAVIWLGQKFSYGHLLQRVRHWEEALIGNGIEPGSITAIEADFSPNSIAVFLALVANRCVVVPLSSLPRPKRLEALETAQVEVLVKVKPGDRVSIADQSRQANHALYTQLRKSARPGLVLFSSGSTGRSKGVVHDLTRLLEKFKVRRRQLRTIAFLLFDHIGGVNTMLYSLSNGGSIITVRERTPDEVLGAIEDYEVELLPTSPTFLNLVLLSGAYQRHDLSSLRIVSYGTEPMPETILRRCHELLPKITLQQTYGLSEIGIMRSKSRSSNSLWVKIGGEGFETRVVSGVLQIKARSSMLGYLNSPSPITQDGWFDTGDIVEVDGEYLRIVGRESDVINVGGAKVYPSEVEGVIQQLDNVAEVTVYGEKNQITGNIVCARVGLVREEQEKAFKARLSRHCRQKLEKYKVPIKLVLTERPQYSERFKKVAYSLDRESDESSK